MATTGAWFGNALKQAFLGNVNWTASSPTNVKVALYTGSTPTDIQDGWTHRSDIATISEVSNGNGYTTRGKALANPDISYTSAGNIVKLNADDTVWTDSTIDATIAIIYYDTGTDSTSVLLGYLIFNETKSSLNGTFTIDWSEREVLRATANDEA